MNTKMAGQYRTSEGELDFVVPTPSLHRDDSVMHILAAIAQPDPSEMITTNTKPETS